MFGGKLELNQNILGAYRLLIRAYQQNFEIGLPRLEVTSGGSRDGKWDVQLSKRQNVSATTAVNTATTTVTCITNDTLLLLLLSLLLYHCYYDTSTVKAMFMKVKFYKLLRKNLN